MTRKRYRTVRQILVLAATCTALAVAADKTKTESQQAPNTSQEISELRAMLADQQRQIAELRAALNEQKNLINIRQAVRPRRKGPPASNRPRPAYRNSGRWPARRL